MSPEPEPVEPEITWSLNTASLPTAPTGSAYSYSFYNHILPTGVTGFSWSSNGLPSWATLNPSTGVMTGTPSASDVGTKSFSVTASREGTSSQKAYSVNVETPCIRASQAADNLVGWNFCNYEGISMFHSENGYLFKNESDATTGYRKAPTACTAKGKYRLASATEIFSYMRKKNIPSYTGYWSSGTRFAYRIGSAEYTKSAQSSSNYRYLCIGSNAN